MPTKPEIVDFRDDMIAWRRDIHAHPETAFEEHRTAALVGEKLESRGGCAVRNPRYDFNDDALVYGASYWAELVEQELAV